LIVGEVEVDWLAVVLEQALSPTARPKAAKKARGRRTVM